MDEHLHKIGVSKMTHTHASPRNTNHISPNQVLALFVLFFSNILFAQTDTKDAVRKTKDANEALIYQYIQSKGEGIISFDASNIKQFWIDNSVVSNKDSFEVLLKNKESIPLKIQLANVNETQDCKIEVVAETKDFCFSVLNNVSKNVSSSTSENDFLNYKVASAVLHLEDTAGSSFSLVFMSKNYNILNIKRIILSFSDNHKSTFLSSPGVLIITGNDVTGGGKKEIHENENSFSISGNWFGIYSKKKILVSDTPITNSVTIKNIGDKTTMIYFGYAPHSEKGQQINGKNIPYKNINQILTVISSEDNSNKIIVDSYPEWTKGCYLALNAKEDLSDFPNFSFIGTIAEARTIDDKRTEIILDKQIKAIKEGTKIRVQSLPGNTYLYTNIKRLPPGEEIKLFSTIKKDDSFFEYSPEALCKGTYYVTPLIISTSIDPKEESTILIKDFSVSY